MRATGVTDATLRPAGCQAARPPGTCLVEPGQSERPAPLGREGRRWRRPSPGALLGIRNFVPWWLAGPWMTPPRAPPRPVHCGHLWGRHGAPEPQASGGGGLLPPRRFVWLEKEHPPVLTIRSVQRGWIPRYLF